MGTRNLVAVIHKGEYKIAQYGQWDGYPSGQGSEVCNFLQTKMDLNKFKQAVGECKFLTDKEISERWIECGASPDSDFVSMDISSKFKQTYPALSRDAGATVLEMVQNGARHLKNSVDFAADSLFCEWAYVVDLDNEVLEVYKGFNKAELEDGERFKAFDKYEPDHRTEKYYPVKLVKKLPFAQATKQAMADLSAELNKDEE